MILRVTKHCSDGDHLKGSKFITDRLRTLRYEFQQGFYQDVFDLDL